MFNIDCVDVLCLGLCRVLVLIDSAVVGLLCCLLTVVYTFCVVGVVGVGVSRIVRIAVRDSRVQILARNNKSRSPGTRFPDTFHRWRKRTAA